MKPNGIVLIKNKFISPIKALKFTSTCLQGTFLFKDQLGQRLTTMDFNMALFIGCNFVVKALGIFLSNEHT